MPTRFAVDALRALLIVALLVVVALQLAVLPWLSGVVAAEMPDAAFLRWPLLALSILGLACVDVGILCTIRLLGFTRRGDVFSALALRWVDGIIASLLAGSVVCLATVTYQASAVGGPLLFSLMLLMGIVGGVGMALLMIVMRSLLVQATTLRLEMAAVI